MHINTLVIVGVGLIGGSIGLAVRRKNSFGRIIGVGRNSSLLEKACEKQILDTYTTELEVAVSQADLIVFCTPVDQIVPQVIAAANHAKPGTILTDAGSTKARIVRQLENKLPTGIHFVGSHPLAGSEKRGHDAARADLFQGRTTIVTPTDGTDESALGKTITFWRSLGSDVTLLDPEQHDRILGTTSHLPHLLAAALAGILPNEWQPFTATGFRDTTRIASGDPGLWTAIFRENKEALCESMIQLTDRMSAFLEAIVQDDVERLNQLLTQAKQVRDALGN